MQETIWTLLPPVIAIVLALMTKEVYLSLFVGIISGALLYTNFSFGETVSTTLELMGSKIGGNIGIVVFLILLGMLVKLLTHSGASRAYGEWASSKIKSKKCALFATAGLGALIFVDDYFNCLTVGTVMTPITDKHKITRTKLAYIIDATAAPICIIAPISSWAAAVSSSLPDGTNIDGFSLFVKTIPFNLYALLTIIMVIMVISLDFDFSKMKKFEQMQTDGEVEQVATLEDAIPEGSNGKVIDLLLPILSLIVLCISFMLYTGGIFEGASITQAFASCDAPTSLALGSFFAIIVTAILYLPRRIMKFKEVMDSLADGFKAMVPAILILTFAWTLGGICGADYLNAGAFVGNVVANSSISLAIIPAVFFIVSLGLAFSTGTSWGTFAILLPIIVSVFSGVESQLFVISVSAMLAGAVCGDHISPISDTTIMASTGAGCNHIDHVTTQMPYALIIALISFIGYLIAGFAGNGYLGLGVGAMLTVTTLIIINQIQKKKLQSINEKITK
ncbi:MAG: Na+/H+ antiporter NhaC family protein [Oscillospiraceae bacterium]